MPEYIYATYNELMKNGWRMKEIDEMDMLGFLRLRAWDARREQEKKKPPQRFIDEVWPGGEAGRLIPLFNFHQQKCNAGTDHRADAV